MNLKNKFINSFKNTSHIEGKTSLSVTKTNIIIHTTQTMIKCRIFNNTYGVLAQPSDFTAYYFRVLVSMYFSKIYGVLDI